MNLVAADISRRTLNPGEDDADSCRLRFRGSRREVSFRQILSLRPSSGPGCGCAVISSSVSARGQNSLHSFVAKESVLISEIRVRFFQLLVSLFSPLPPVHRLVFIRVIREIRGYLALVAAAPLSSSFSDSRCGPGSAPADTAAARDRRMPGRNSPAAAPG